MMMFEEKALHTLEVKCLLATKFKGLARGGR